MPPYFFEKRIIEVFFSYKKVINFGSKKKETFVF